MRGPTPRQAAIDADAVLLKNIEVLRTQHNKDIAAAKKARDALAGEDRSLHTRIDDLTTSTAADDALLSQAIKDAVATHTTDMQKVQGEINRLDQADASLVSDLSSLRTDVADGVDKLQDQIDHLRSASASAIARDVEGADRSRRLLPRGRRRSSGSRSP